MIGRSLLFRWFPLLLLGLVLGVLPGCATTDDVDNASVRPWNSPKGWENGLPSNLTEGR